MFVGGKITAMLSRSRSAKVVRLACLVLTVATGVASTSRAAERAAAYVNFGGPLFSIALQEEAAPTFEPRPVVLQLSSGTRLKGTLAGETDSDYLLASPELGQLSVPKTDVIQVLPADAALGPTPAGAAAPPPPGVFGSAFLRGWTKNVTLGFTGKSGNVDSFDVYGKFAADYEREDLRWRVRANYVFGTASGERNKDEGYANARRDWLFPGKPLFYWAEARLDYNDFKDYKLRAGGFVGIGYTFYDTPKFKLLSRLGVGGSYEFGDVNTFNPEALLSVEATYQLTATQSVEFLNTFFPDLGHLGRNRNVTEAAYTVKIDRGRGLSLKFGAQNEYDSYTEDNSYHNDLTYYGALVFDF